MNSRIVRNIIETQNDNRYEQSLKDMKNVSEENKKYNFIITDFNKEISVTYSGILPNLFVEGQGAVVEGNLISRKTFVGTKILKNLESNKSSKLANELYKSFINKRKKMFFGIEGRIIMAIYNFSPFLSKVLILLRRKFL